MTRFKMNAITLLVGICSPLLSQFTIAESSQSDAKGIAEDDSLSVVNRNYYFDRDFRNVGSDEQSYQEEWAHAVLLNYVSGYTQGAVGLGIDVHAYAGLKLDSGRGRNSGGEFLLPVGDDGRAQDTFSEVGAALKLRLSSTEFKYGALRPEAPVLTTGDSFLLPETVTGFHVFSEEIENLSVEAGHFTAYNNYASTNHDDELYVNYGEGRTGNSIDFGGAMYKFNDFFTAGFYASHYDETWNQYFGHLNVSAPLTDKDSINVEFNMYRTSDTGDSYQGEISNIVFSLEAAYTHAMHTFTLSHQAVNGNTPFDFVGYDSIWLANSMQYSDFVAPEEKSYRAAYTLDMSELGVPGLNFSLAYTTGSDIDGSRADPNGGYTYFGEDGKHWERNLEVTYVVQAGVAKDLSFSLLQSTHRGNADQTEGNIEEIQFKIEYPLELM